MESAASTKHEGHGVREYAGDSSASVAQIVIIEPKLLIAECLASWTRQLSGMSVVTRASADAWLESPASENPSLVVYSMLGQLHDSAALATLERLAKANALGPTVALCESENLTQIVAVLERGARGYISTGMPLAAVTGALRLVACGGMFVPAAGLVAASERRERAAQTFGHRQAEVADALRLGKPNKIIAYELNMSESTVKVHVRSIMNKLNAKNRTEVAVKLMGAP